MSFDDLVPGQRIRMWLDSMACDTSRQVEFLHYEATPHGRGFAVRYDDGHTGVIAPRDIASTKREDVPHNAIVIGQCYGENPEDGDVCIKVGEEFVRLQDVVAELVKLRRQVAEISAHLALNPRALIQ